MTPDLPHRIIVGLGFGDEGKGATIDYLAEREGYMDVVRYNGGAQAAHHVVRDSDGHVHCFAQVGAAALRAGRHTHLSRFVVVEPLGLDKELAALEAAGIKGCRTRQHIDTRATMLTPYHRALNRITERARGAARHGSCGLGVGVAHLDRTWRRAPWVIVEDVLGGQAHLRGKLEQVRLSMLDRAMQASSARHAPTDDVQRQELDVLRDSTLSSWLAARYEAILCAHEEMLDREGARLNNVLRTRGVLFEGAQGVCLDPDSGFFPHVTATRTTPHQAWELLDAASSSRDRITLGICRAYATRHGAGPFPSEDEDLTSKIPDLHNAHGPWQGGWRVGWFDEVLLAQALAQCDHGIDALVMTCLDRLDGLDELRTRDASDTGYTNHAPWHAARTEAGTLHEDAVRYAEGIASRAGLPIEHLATGLHSSDRVMVESVRSRLLLPLKS